MSGCCGPSRRQVLGWGAVAGGAVTVPLAVAGPAAAASAGAPSGSVVPVDLELVTLAEDHAIVTWYTGVAGTNDGLGRMEPAPSDGEVVYGTHPARLNRTAYGPQDTPYHYAELTDLEPGQTYYYQARSAGRPAHATVLVGGNATGTAPLGFGISGPFCFTTPEPPPGDFRFALALCNDIHIGETVAGLVGGIDLIPGIEQVPGRPPYAEVMAEALVNDARERGAEYLLAAGDITAEAEPADVRRARELLDRFGTQGRDYFAARGNHDRAHEGEAYATCSPGQWQGNDCFADTFFPGDGEPSYFAHDLHGLRVIGLDTYDKPGNGGDAGGLSAEQLAWFRAQLAAAPDQPTVVFGHHPLVSEGNILSIGGSTTLGAEQRRTILQAYADAPGVFLHHAGHTHRNKRARLADGVLQQEVAAAKEYPGGFTLLRVHTGGFALNFYKTQGSLAREWSARSRQEIGGLWPQLSLGHSVADRNSVAARDLSGVGR